MMYKSLALFILITTGIQLFGCSGNTETPDQSAVAKNVGVAEFEKLMSEKKGIILDVRTPEEVAEGFIPGATNQNFYEEDFKSSLEKLDKNKPVFVYCAAGGRSGKAMNQMAAMGFKEVYNLEGGFGAWSSQGKPITK